MKYRHIVFDVDGTLINTEYAILHSLQEILETLQKKVPLNQLEFVLGITGEDALQQLQVNNIPDVLKAWEEKLHSYGSTMEPFEGIPELLKSLSKAGYETGIVTSRTLLELKADLDRFGFERYFKTVVCADDTKEHKPSPEPLQKYMEKSGAGKEQTLYIGDSRYDSLCARNAGVDFALAMWGSHTRDLSADYFLEKPEDLLTIINS